MTVVKDKTTVVEHRIFVDAYTLEEVEDKPATETERGVWSMYEMMLENGKDNNLKEWQKSDQLIKSIETASASKGVNINVTVTEENIKKLSGDAAITASTNKKLGVPLIGQEDQYFCVPASCQMISRYYGYPTPSQKYIYDYEGGDYDAGLAAEDALHYCKTKLGKSGTVIFSVLNNIDAVREIDNYRPFFSLITGHSRVCQGYLIQNGYTYLYINDPEPVGSNGTPKIERTYGSREIKRVYVRN